MRTAEAPAFEAEVQAAARRRVLRRRRWRRFRRTLIVAVLGIGVVAVPLRLADLPPPIFVRVASVVRLFAPGVTLGEAAEAYGVKPRPGNFLDVEGVLIRPGAYPGHLAVNGAQAGPDRVLTDGDVVVAVDGVDRTEGLVEQVVPVPGGRVANPQASLATAPGKQVITKGAVSGKVVSSVFEPTGPYTAPLEVAITFDDGPSPTYTPQVLDILARFHVKATFFVVGTMVEKFPDLLRREIRMGMAIGNHSYDHPIGQPFATLPKKQIRSEIAHMKRILAGFHVTPVGFRPPGGSWSDFVRDTAESLGLRTILWAVDSRDWTRPPVNGLVKRVLNQVRPGAIILLHDGGGDRSHTVAALPRIIKGLRARGLEPVAIT